MIGFLFSRAVRFADDSPDPAVVDIHTYDGKKRLREGEARAEADGASMVVRAARRETAADRRRKLYRVK